MLIKIQIEVFWGNFSYRRTVTLNEITTNHLFDKNQNNLGGSKGSFTNTLKKTYKHESEGEAIESFKLLSFEPDKIADSVSIQPNIDLSEDGGGLSGVLDQLRDTHPEKFEELNRELNTWFHEYDRILFEVPEDGKKTFGNCRYCELRKVVKSALENLNPTQGKENFKVAIGVAVPAIEAWLLCGVNPHATEANWITKQKEKDFSTYNDRKCLKAELYGSEITSSKVRIERSTESAERLAENIEQLEILFPEGFGNMANEIRSWKQ